jgi:branched-chain amino acid transport system substrate-binding protein
MESVNSSRWTAWQRGVAGAGLLLLAGCGKPSVPVVKIGFVAPLTGDQAAIGQDLLHGAQLAVEQANERGFIIPHTRLELSSLDDQHSPAQAVVAAKKLAADPDVIAIVGHLNSSCTLPAAAIYAQARMVQIAPAASNPQLSRQGFDTFFRTCATDDLQGPAAALFAVRELGVKRIVIIDDMTTYGRGLAQEFERKAKALGADIAAHEGITQGDKDFTSLLTKVKALNPELIYFAGVYPDGALLLKQRSELGIPGHFMGGDGLYDATLIRLATPPAAQGMYLTTTGPDIHSVPSAQAFIKAYEARFGTVGSFAAYSYEATTIAIEAIHLAGKKERQAVLQAMRRVKDFPGVFGVQNFDERGDSLLHNIGVYQVKDGAFVFLKTATLDEDATP